MTIDENSTLVEVLQDVGDAVREKGVSGEWKGYQLPSAVRSIRSDPVYDSRVTIQVNGVSNGSFTVNQTSDSTINLQTLTLDQVSAIMPSKTSDLTNDSGFTTESAVAASYATKSEVETVSASVSAIGSSVADLNAKLLDKRDYIDLKYPAVAQDGDNRFGISSWSYSFPVQGIGYQGTLNNYTWDGEYGVWAYDIYSPRVRTSDGQNFQFASAQSFDTGWTDPLALSQVYPQANVPLQIDVAHGQMNCELTPSFTSTTNLVLENQLSAYATTSALEIVSANVSAMASSVSALGSSVQALASSIDEKRDYDDLSYSNLSSQALSRAPTYGIGKMIATPSDGTDPVVMDTFFIHKNSSDPSDSLGSTWYAPSFVFAGTTDGTNFRMVNISFQTLTTFTKTQLLAGEVTFNYQDKTWTLTAELGDGMIDWWNININNMDWKTTTYSYDPSTRIAKWRPSTIDTWFITREYPTSPGIKLNGNWTAKVWRGTSEAHGDKMVEQINVGPAYGYGGGVEKTFTYGDNTSFLKLHLMGYPFQSNLGFAERIPQQVGMLKNDIGYITMDGAERSLKTAWRTWEYEPDGLKFTAEEANSTVAMQAVGSAPSVSLEYTTDGSTWNDFIVGTTVVTLPNVGDKMWMRAKTTNSGFASSSSNYNKFVMTGKVATSGSIMYLLKNDGEQNTLSSNYCLGSLFRFCTALTTAPELPATTLTNNCYAYMFQGCTSLTTAPTLPATTMAYDGYYFMFYGCTSLNSIKIAYTGNFSGDGVPTEAFWCWVYNVSSTGTFYYNGSDTTTGKSAIPNNWNVVQF